MADEKRLAWAEMAAIACVMVLSMAYGFLVLRVLLARQSGLGPAAALRDAISGGWPIVALFLLVGAAVALTTYRLVMPRAAGQGVSPETARAAGSRQWRRMRLLATILALPLILLTAGWVGFIMLTGKDLDVHVLMMLGLAVWCAVVVMVYWIVKPSREYLYAQGTGDRSRIDDERAQEVKGRAADTTINVFMGVMILVGVPYEVIIQGVLPFRSYAEMAVICLVWGLASWRWKRKL